MPPFRNPFVRKPVAVNGAAPSQDENYPPPGPNGIDKPLPRPSITGSRASSVLSIKLPKEETNEFKLSGTPTLQLPALTYTVLQSSNL